MAGGAGVNGRIALFTFIGTSERALDEAVIDATRHADTWLETHQWKRADGSCGYNAISTAWYDGTTYRYVLHFLGPSDPVK